MAQAVSFRPLIAEGRVQFWASQCGSCGGQSGIGTGFCTSTSVFPPIPVAARSKVWVCSRSIAGIGSSHPARGMDVCLICVGLITRPEESYRVWCVYLSVIVKPR